MKRLGILLVLLLLAAACGGGGSPTSEPGDATARAASAATADFVRLGFFPNVTHAPALVGVARGLFTDELGDTAMESATFNAGTEAIEAMFAEALDMTFIGPNPAINAHAQSGGQAIRIVSGTTSGGATLVVRSDITDPAQLAGKVLATPSLGNTQDVALRAWLLELGMTADLEGGGDVSIVPQSNSQTLETFIAGEIDGAWVPEPWATRLILEGGGSVLLNEKDLWPGGEFVTTHLIGRTEFLEQYPGTVAAIIRGLVNSIDAINADPAAAQQDTNAQIAAISGSELPAEVMTGSWENLTFTVDPIASSLRKSADDAQAVGLLDPVDLEGIYDLTLLNGILTELGKEEVAS